MTFVEHAYWLGVKEAVAAFQPVAPPSPPKPLVPGTPASSNGRGPGSPQPSLLPQLPTNPAAAISNAAAAQSHDASFNFGAKMIPDVVNPNVKISGERYDIPPSNPKHIRQPATNYDGIPTRSVSQGFEALRTQKNLDLVNAGGEALVGTPQGGIPP